MGLLKRVVTLQWAPVAARLPRVAHYPFLAWSLDDGMWRCRCGHVSGVPRTLQHRHYEHSVGTLWFIGFFSNGHLTAAMERRTRSLDLQIFLREIRSLNFCELSQF